MSVPPITFDPGESPICRRTQSDGEGFEQAPTLDVGDQVSRDQGLAYAAQLIEYGVFTRFPEAVGQIHGCFTLRQAIPSAQRDLLSCLVDLRTLIREAQSEAG